MGKEVQIFTEEDRPVCKRCEDKKAVLSKGKLAYKGFCSGCYQTDKTERRMTEGYDDPTRPAKHKPLPRKTSTTGEATTSADTAKRKKVPGGFGTPRPVSGPTPDDVLIAFTHKTGWCMTGHHEGITEDDLYPDGKTGLLAGTFPVICPKIIWLCMTAEWAVCPCDCHEDLMPVTEPLTSTQ